MSKITIIFIVILCFFSCGPKKEGMQWKGTITEKDGITEVRNPKEPMYQDQIFSIEPELSIGKQTGAEEYLFGRISNEKTCSSYFNSHSISFLWA